MIVVVRGVDVIDALAKGVLHPAGPVAAGERLILLDALAIMLSVVVPTMCCIVYFAWKYRRSNSHARYRPDWSYSGQLELLVWSVPALVVLFLGGIAWVSSHDLDPFKALPGKQAPLQVQVVSLDWKWLFIYPQQNLASVNHLVIPAGVPIHFTLTSATVMNSFFVPQLGSQIYTMAGMATQLNLQADAPGNYMGLSAQFSGDGFSDMRFEVEAIPADQFEGWVQRSRSAQPLDAAAYAKLAADHSPAASAATFGTVARHLFDDIVQLKPPQAAAGT